MFGELVPREKSKAPFISIEEALEETRRGRMIILMDDEQRENEGDLCMAAEKATPEAINFMAKYGRGLICLPMAAERIDQLGLSMMVGDNQAPLGTAFTRADHRAARAAARESRRRIARPPFCRPCARTRPAPSSSRPATSIRCARAKAGCWCAPARPRARVDLARLAGLKPAGVICEILKEDGTMARRDDLVEFARSPRTQNRHRRRHHRVPAAQ